MVILLKSVWVQEDDIRQNIINSKQDVNLELIWFSNSLQNIDSNIEATTPNIVFYFFYFEKTDLYLAYPIRKLCKDEFFYTM